MAFRKYNNMMKLKGSSVKGFVILTRKNGTGNWKFLTSTKDSMAAYKIRKTLANKYPQNKYVCMHRSRYQLLRNYQKNKTNTPTTN